MYIIDLFSLYSCATIQCRVKEQKLMLLHLKPHCLHLVRLYVFYIYLVK